MTRMPALVLLLLSGTVVSAQSPRPDAARTKPVDDAVEKGLAFLKNNQRDDGHWALGRQRNPAITGLCVMSFLSAGHVPGEGKYGPTIEKAIKAVLQMQQPNGLIAGDGGHEMYHHGISTLMLAEVAGMTQGKLAEEIKKALEKAVRIILLAQRKGRTETDSSRGGWRYQVAGDDADISVTGWQILALRAAKNVGCDVPAERIKQAVEYVKRCQDASTGAFRYDVNSQITAPCTGTSILCLSLCATRKHEFQTECEKGGGYLIKQKVEWGNGRHFFYSAYYCSQAMFQLGGNYWGIYSEQLKAVLLKQQGDTGKWDDPDGQGFHYATAMAILALTVEYRLLPIYQADETSQKRK